MTSLKLNALIKIVPLDNKKDGGDEKPYFDWIRQQDKILLKLDGFKNGCYSVIVNCGEDYKGSLDFEINSK